MGVSKRDRFRLSSVVCLMTDLILHRHSLTVLSVGSIQAQVPNGYWDT
jgi:hypothetical protein